MPLFLILYDDFLKFSENRDKEFKNFLSLFCLYGKNWVQAFVILKAYLYLGRKNILHFIRPAPNSIYNCHNHKGLNCHNHNRVKLITQFRLDLSHSFCLHCPLFLNKRSPFFSILSSLDCNLLDNTDSTLTKTLFFGNASFKSNKNLKILIATIDYILSTKRFDEPLF